MKLFVLALAALVIATITALPQNQADGGLAEDQTVSIVKQKGAAEQLKRMNDGAVVQICNNVQCETVMARDAKGSEREIYTIREVKGDSPLEKALSPTVTQMSESLKALNAQRALLENLEASMAALTMASNKGQQLAERTKGQFAEAMTRGIYFSPANYKGADQFARPPSKGYAAPPSKGGSMAATMQLEAAMCPMTMYELGKCQKLSNEKKLQMESANAVAANLMADKQRLERALAASEALKAKAEEQAAFNAKYAAEQKNRAEVAEAAFAQSEAEKAVLKSQKEALETQLVQTQNALSEERSMNAQLTDALKTCNEEKDALTVALGEQTARAIAAEEQLAATQAQLTEETSARIECEESLSFTRARLAKSEEDLNKERVAREQTEEELMKTMTDLASCQRELRVTTEILSRTQDELQEKTQLLARETAAREALEAKVATLVENVRELEETLRNTQRALEDEQNAHARTQRVLAETREELAATEAARQALEEAKQQLEDELAETKSQLEVMTAERDQLQVTLDATSAALAECTAGKMTCESELSDEKAITAQLSSQLNDAIEMLKMEKEAREQLTATIVQVQEASMKVQEEVKKLQVENLLLQQQVEKLRNEQEAALAMAAGCPPTYEKFGSSCYKYVREKTQWRMAQEQCMKDSGNLVAIESTQEQIYLTNYLKRHGANDAYAYTSGYKAMNGWKWKGAANNHMGATGVEFWYSTMMKMQPGYNCQAMYLADAYKYGMWKSLPCYSSAHYVCEYQLLPHGTEAPANLAETKAIQDMAREAPAYLAMAARRA